MGVHCDKSKERQLNNKKMEKHDMLVRWCVHKLKFLNIFFMSVFV